mmetsp:Transcript_24330/g.66003  ORF Transcript_24330/g.66003 Transcript_24330/m.66003 type:complete len:243 (+) Transcript_24330:295-1023(+)
MTEELGYHVRSHLLGDLWEEVVHAAVHLQLLLRGAHGLVGGVALVGVLGWVTLLLEAEAHMMLGEEHVAPVALDAQHVAQARGHGEGLVCLGVAQQKLVADAETVARVGVGHAQHGRLLRLRRILARRAAVERVTHEAVVGLAEHRLALLRALLEHDGVVRRGARGLQAREHRGAPPLHVCWINLAKREHLGPGLEVAPRERGEEEDVRRVRLARRRIVLILGFAQDRHAHLAQRRHGWRQG